MKWTKQKYNNKPKKAVGRNGTTLFEWIEDSGNGYIKFDIKLYIIVITVENFFFKNLRDFTIIYYSYYFSNPYIRSLPIVTNTVAILLVIFLFVKKNFNVITVVFTFT